MDNTSVKLPVYLKLSQIVIGIVAFFFVLYIGQGIIVPLVFATVLAILLNPLVNFLCRKSFNRVLAIALTLIVAMILVSALVYFIGFQVAMFSDSFPQFKEKFSVFFTDAEDWIAQTFNISNAKIDERLLSAKKELLSSGPNIIGRALGTISGVLVFMLLLPVYIFMILFYKPLLLEFISQLFKQSKQNTVAEVLVETKSLIQNYLIGLLAEAAIVATLNSAGLLILGIQYAILLGIIGAILNLIPYIGGLIAISLPMLIAFATKSPIYAFWVLVVYLIVQFIDNQIIIPKIVGSRVKINALVSIVVVLIGGALWGVAGMFLAIPLTAIVKVVFDRIPPLQPFGFLLGDNQPEIGKVIFNFKNRVKRKKTSHK